MGITLLPKYLQITDTVGKKDDLTQIAFKHDGPDIGSPSSRTAA